MIALPRPLHEPSLVHGRLCLRHGPGGRASQDMASRDPNRFSLCAGGPRLRQL
jgi:hypothetical protein